MDWVCLKLHATCPTVVESVEERADGGVAGRDGDGEAGGG
eukprot:CAMPEP_0196729160 /NCGR_PEP_ID=MMETSP1091-20130531/9631_1 /TAXON_ID=302021 /ORGANISM="Rhodomonas sp., Strain CCMP768" /LENGTH=39 /DNA_ID= /DNA_START= /DNA_END= /DNA_ORIENTATION=